MVDEEEEEDVVAEEESGETVRLQGHGKLSGVSPQTAPRTLKLSDPNYNMPGREDTRDIEADGGGEGGTYHTGYPGVFWHTWSRLQVYLGSPSGTPVHCL